MSCVPTVSIDRAQTDLQNILRQPYDNAKVTINLPFMFQRIQGFSYVRFTCKNRKNRRRQCSYISLYYIYIYHMY